MGKPQAAVRGGDFFLTHTVVFVISVLRKHRTAFIIRTQNVTNLAVCSISIFRLVFLWNSSSLQRICHDL